MRNQLRVLYVCLVVLPFMVVGSLAAGLAAEISIADMASGSDVIVLGKCTDLRSVWVDRTLVTLATVSVTESLKGEAGNEVIVVLPGGTDTNRKFPVAMTFPGAPQMSNGEDVFLFLVRDAEVFNGLVVAGFSQGKFSIVESEEGEKLVSRDLINVRLKNNAGTKRGTTYLTPLAEFKTKVRASLP